MRRHRERQAGSVLLVVGLALTATLVAWGLHGLVPDATTRQHDGPQRIVSLSPAMTETLFAIGAGSQVVGVSEYTESPSEALGLPRAGTAITPDYEQLVRLRPTMVVAESTGGPRLQQLRAVARTQVIEWLSVEDVATGTRELGRLTGHEREANDLASRLEARMHRSPDPAAPRVLLILGYPGGQDELWFVRRNSIHGKALTAAGARNAIDEDVTGPPTLSIEQLLRVDPDIIIVLTSTGDDSTLEHLRRLEPLRAVEANRLTAVHDPGILIPGPRIIELIDVLHSRITAFEAKR
jgi:ABC-type Fe3+-hydroxamate transport system substrate-binding protein